jgi:SOS response regulatory protein OraA/RecX
VLEQQYQKKYRNTAIDDYNEKAKRIRFLQYRGFTLDAIYQVVN